MNYCIKCGAQLVSGSLYCHNCGEKIANKQSGETFIQSQLPVSIEIRNKNFPREKANFSRATGLLLLILFNIILIFIVTILFSIMNSVLNPKIYGIYLAEIFGKHFAVIFSSIIGFAKGGVLIYVWFKLFRWSRNYFYPAKGKHLPPSGDMNNDNINTDQTIDKLNIANEKSLDPRTEQFVESARNYVEQLCRICEHFDSSKGVCREIHERVLDNSKYFKMKCNGDLFKKKEIMALCKYCHYFLERSKFGKTGFCSFHKISTLTNDYCPDFQNISV